MYAGEVPKPEIGYSIISWCFRVARFHNCKHNFVFYDVYPLLLFLMLANFFLIFNPWCCCCGSWKPPILLQKFSTSCISCGSLISIDFSPSSWYSLLASSLNICFACKICFSFQIYEFFELCLHLMFEYFISFMSVRLWFLRILYIFQCFSLSCPSLGNLFLTRQ